MSQAGGSKDGWRKTVQAVCGDMTAIHAARDSDQRSRPSQQVFYTWPSDGPLSSEQLDGTIRAVQDRLDLLAVLRERYAQRFEEAGERWRGLCFLPSLVPGFKGSCAEQDAGRSREAPRNLWVSEGELTRVWRCHSCKRRGDVIDLIEHADRLPRQGQAISLRAVRVAAQLAGVAYVMDGRDPDETDEPSDFVYAEAVVRPTRAPARVVDFETARMLNVKVASYWTLALLGPVGADALRELYRRGITDAQINRFKLGYARLSWRDLVPKIKPARVDDGIALGLIGRNRHGKLYDRQRDRMIFPYCVPALNGRKAAITGFAGRMLHEDPKAPKWLNSNNAEGVWEKRSALFGLYQAMARARELGYVVVVEGAHDVLAFDRIGVPAVALVSAAFTAAHAAVLSQVLGVSSVVLAFDGDSTGRAAVVPAATVLLAHGFPLESISVVDVGDEQDPGGLTAHALETARRAPLALATFCKRHCADALISHRVALLAALPRAAADELRESWGIEAEAVTRHRARAGSSHTPAQRFVVALLADPAQARRIARADVEDALAADKLALGRLDALHFSDDICTDTEALAPALRRAWLAAQLAAAQAREKRHASRDPFADDGGHGDFVAWAAERDRLKKHVKNLRKALDALPTQA